MGDGQLVDDDRVRAIIGYTVLELVLQALLYRQQVDTGKKFML